MYNSVHGKFISTPLKEILRDGINASASIKTGVETYPLGEYFFSVAIPPYDRSSGAEDEVHYLGIGYKRLYLSL